MSAVPHHFQPTPAPERPAWRRALDARIDARAKALEPLAEGMCKRIQRMDALDNALEVRLPNGKPIDFLSTK